MFAKCLIGSNAKYVKDFSARKNLVSRNLSWAWWTMSTHTYTFKKRSHECQKSGSCSEESYIRNSHTSEIRTSPQFTVISAYIDKWNSLNQRWAISKFLPNTNNFGSILNNTNTKSFGRCLNNTNTNTCQGALTIPIPNTNTTQKPNTNTLPNTNTVYSVMRKSPSVLNPFLLTWKICFQ